MITWLQLISMMIQLTISFRLIIIINWNRKNVSLSLQLVRFRFESHSIIIKLRTKKSTNLCFFVNNKDTTETIFFGKSWWRRAFELTNLFFGLIVCFLCVRCFFPCLTFDVLHSEMSVHWRFHFILFIVLIRFLSAREKKLTFWQQIQLYVKPIRHP